MDQRCEPPLEQAHRICPAGADTAGEALHQQQRPVTASPASRPSLASVVTATKTKAAMGKLNAAAAAVKSAREQAATEDTGVAQSQPAHSKSRSGSSLAALPTIPEEIPYAPDGCTVHDALAWESSESDQSSANAPVTGTRTDGGHRKRDEGRKLDAPSHREARGRLTARGTVTLKATAGQGGSLRAVCSIENRTLTLSIAQRPPRAESGEEPESQSTSAVMVVQVPLEELAVRLQRGRANMFTISTLHKQRLYDEICCFTEDQGKWSEWINHYGLPADGRRHFRLQRGKRRRGARRFLICSDHAGDYSGNNVSPSRRQSLLRRPRTRMAARPQLPPGLRHVQSRVLRVRKDLRRLREMSEP
jgi:hypothetical protein